ncbi:gustatory receptor 5a for trehalose [Scaptodrosophila lebanonensis]|uniref:Gustatory receptor n=1 Tax=Drosophila lebanonensis TaxID=7225 RepID=A0A6J2TT80_DROLE|nr:gustatory receptor 5a for trehalose [Scaptodrosophila lebanonensis]
MLRPRCRRPRNLLERSWRILLLELRSQNWIKKLGQRNERWRAAQRYGTRQDFSHNGSFHEAVGAVLVMAQCFCVMPVRGILASTPDGLSFSWHSWRTWYCVGYMCTTVLDTIFTINQVVHGKLDVRNMEPIIFHVSILLASVQFLHLARKWPKLMHQWACVEQGLPKFENWQQREHLARKIHRVTFVLMMLSLTEHLLSIVSAIHFANYCPARKDPIESYFYSSGSQIFFIFPYSAWLAWLGKAQNVLLTFGWSFMDIFVMIIGIGLSELLARHTICLKSHAERDMSEAFWTSTRTQYRLIVELIIEVDEAVSGLIMLSFANNLYFICLQLLKSINKMPSMAHAVYFYFSLSFLLIRSLAVLLYVSAVNERANEPLGLLRLVPAATYNEEVARFGNELAGEEVALSGLRFFSVTRKLVLTVAGTIVTYELVLIQFHEDEKEWHCGTD